MNPNAISCSQGSVGLMSALAADPTTVLGTGKSHISLSGRPPPCRLRKHPVGPDASVAVLGVLARGWQSLARAFRQPDYTNGKAVVDGTHLCSHLRAIQIFPVSYMLASRRDRPSAAIIPLMVITPTTSEGYKSGMRCNSNRVRRGEDLRTTAAQALPESHTNSQYIAA